jgi:hypothetical protein
MMGKYFTRIEESGWAAYLDDSKTNAALYPFGVGNTEAEAIEWLENSILVLEDIASANGYIKLEPGECVVKYEKWLPYLKKAYDAARLMEKHDAFTVKWYHNDWPSIEMLDELTAAIEGAVNDDKGA